MLRPVIGALGVAAFMVLAAGAAATAAGQSGHGACARMNRGQQWADMQVFHQLFAHRSEIVRQISVRPDGVETLTESDNPQVTQVLQTHVDSMVARVEEARPFHLRDPLFREIFRNAAKIQVQVERTEKGVRVVETSADSYVARLIQAHAKVVDAFIANGHAEMMRNHPLP
jgi:hypothetical protein